MAGFHLELDNVQEITLPNTAPFVQVHPTPHDGIGLLVVSAGQYGNHSHVALIDYTDPTAVVVGAFLDLGTLGELALDCCALPTTDLAIINRVSENLYLTISYDLGSMTCAQVGSWNTLVGRTDYDIDAVDAVFIAFTDELIVVTAQVDHAMTFFHDYVLGLTYDLGTNELTHVAELSLPLTTGVVGLLVGAMQSGVAFVTAANAVLSTLTWDGTTVVLTDLLNTIGTDIGVTAIWRTGSSTARVGRWDAVGGTGILGYHDIDLDGATVGGLHLYSDPIGANIVACRSGDGTLDIYDGGTALADNLHPRASTGPQTLIPQQYARTVGPLPTAGPHALGIGVAPAAAIAVGRLTETLSERWTEVDAANPDFIDEVTVGTRLFVDFSYEHFGTADNPRPASAAYWRPITSWEIDWGDGTTSSGSGPIDALPYPDVWRETAFTISHVYTDDTGGEYLPLINSTVIDALDIPSDPSFPMYVLVDPGPGRPPLAHRQRRDGVATAGPPLAHVSSG